MTIIPREQHSISRKEISENALKVLYRLNKSGFEAYLVGGGVRDLLLGKKPKDFDITTSATPEQMRKIFRNCRLVGRRFRLAHVMFGKEIIEVSTFRGNYARLVNVNNDEKSTFNSYIMGKSGIILRDNIFGSVKEDAHRRDFSVNSLYYSVVDFTLRDYTGGLKDLQEGTIRLLGDPETRYREDPVRMLRAVRFAAKLRMTLSHETAHPIPKLAALLCDVPPPRLFEELIKLLQTGHGEVAYRLLCEYQLLKPLFPLISRGVTETGDSCMEKMILLALTNADQRLKNERYVNPAFLFSAMLWYPLLAYAQKLIEDRNISYFEAFSIGMNDLLNEQCRILAIPRRLTTMMRDIWHMQFRLSCRNRNNAQQLIQHPKFRSGYNLLALRAEVENDNRLQHLRRWWEEFQVSEPFRQKDMMISLCESVVMSDSLI